MKKLEKFLIVIFFLVSLIFFKDALISSKLPIPSDTIIGLYHPFRDLYSKQYPNGIPFKNFLITDPVRQQYPWKELTVSLEKKFELPLWNPYSFSGTPHLANFQSGAFYPFNLLFFVLDTKSAWTILVVSQILLGGIFLYLYLTYIGLDKTASLLGSVSFSFSGFSIAWLEWNTILHVTLWLPLILLAKEHVLRKVSIQWILILCFAEISSVLAGHLQILFYLLIISNTYLLARIFQKSKEEAKNMTYFFLKKIKIFILVWIFVFLVTVLQWYPTWKFIELSAREVDQATWQQDGWFIPWQHIIQFIAPDFFGNPTTLNYWGTWNYAELIGYIGIIPFVMAMYAIFFRKDKKTLFFGTFFFLSLLFALPTFLAKIPYLLHIPFISSSQPTRLLFITDFSLAVLASLGLDYFIKTNQRKKIMLPLIFLFGAFVSLWLFIYKGYSMIGIDNTHIVVSKSNLILPSLLFGISCFVIILMLFFRSKNLVKIICFTLLVVTSLDLMRFGLKFTPFTDSAYLFPSTEAIEFLKKNIGNYRIMTTDSRILPPNFSVIYRLQSLDGYDPLYLRRYGELVAAAERNRPDINPPFGFNRIITPHNYESRIIDLLGVKYILSLSDLKSSKLKKVFQEGQTQIYENLNVLPRVFFVNRVQNTQTKEEAIQLLFKKDFDLKTQATVEGLHSNSLTTKSSGEAEVIEYSENRVIINTTNNAEGFLVFTDTYYPNWHGIIDGKETPIYKTDYNYRGIFVPKGNHTIIFYMSFL